MSRRKATMNKQLTWPTAGLIAILAGLRRQGVIE
jgi:hypothetical protein